MTILKNKTFLASSVSATLVILLSACGAKPAALPGITSPTGTAPSGTTAPPVSSVPQGSTSSNYTSIPYAFDLTGSSGGSTSPSVPACTNTGNHYSPSCTASGFHTDNHLSVAVSAQGYGWISDQQNSGYTVGFKCMLFNVTVRPKGATSGGRTTTAFVSTTGQNGTDFCAGATPNPSLDFPDQAGSGHGAVEVLVQPMSYDNCRYWGNVSSGGCALNNVYYTHVVTGVATVQID